PTDIYTLSLHDALPICIYEVNGCHVAQFDRGLRFGGLAALRTTLLALALTLAPALRAAARRICGCCGFDHKVAQFLDRGKFVAEDRKSTRLNSSHVSIS